jgi:uncharacterized protein YidB (DUF937 family)
MAAGNFPFQDRFDACFRTTVKTLSEERDMSNKMPSLAALLGLVAIAGYQNRDKIGEFVKGLQNQGGTGPVPGAPASPARPDQGTGSMGAGQAGGSILGGLGELVEQFRNTGQARKADSWVSAGQNEPINEREMEQALGHSLIEQLARQTGLDREELLRRLSQTLPQTVDQLTPEGQLPRFRP